MLTVDITYDVTTRLLAITSISTGVDNVLIGTTGDDMGTMIRCTFDGDMCGFDTVWAEFDVRVPKNLKKNEYLKPAVQFSSDNTLLIPGYVMSNAIHGDLPMQIALENRVAGTRVVSLNKVSFKVADAIDADHKPYSVVIPNPEYVDANIFTIVVGDGINTTFSIPHNLGTPLIDLFCYANTDFKPDIQVSWERTSDDVASVTFSEPPDIDGYTVCVFVPGMTDDVLSVNGVTGHVTQEEMGMVTEWQAAPDNTHFPSEKLVSDTLAEQDSTVVHKTGNMSEDITGIKTFKNDTVFDDTITVNDTSQFNDNVAIGTPSSPPNNIIDSGDIRLDISGNIWQTEDGSKAWLRDIEADSLVIETDAVIKQDLNVQGVIKNDIINENEPVTVDDQLKVTGTMTIGNNPGPGLQEHANLIVYGTVSASDGMQTAGNITQATANSTATLKDTSATSLHVTGNTQIDGTLKVPTIDVNTEIINSDSGEPVKISDNLDVTGTVTSGDKLTVSSGGADIVGVTDVDTLNSSAKATLNSLEVTTTSDLKGATTIGTQQTNANLTVNGNEAVTGSETVTGNITSSSGNIVATAGNVSAGGTGTFGNKLTVQSNGADITGDTTISTKIKVPVVDVNTEIINSDTDEPVKIHDNLNITGNTSIGGTLGVTGDTTLGVLNAGVSTLGATTVNSLSTAGNISQSAGETTLHTLKIGNLQSAKVLVSNGAGQVVESSNIDTTELGCLDGVRSNIQDQIDGKSPNDHRFTSGDPATLPYYGLADTTYYGHVKIVTATVPPSGTNNGAVVPTEARMAEFVNSSIGTATATFRGTYDAENDLGFTSQQIDAWTDPPSAQVEASVGAMIATELTSLGITPTNNDYVFISVSYSTTVDTDFFWRFKYSEPPGSSSGEWVYEYTLNNSSFTAAQWAAINSLMSNSSYGTNDPISLDVVDIDAHMGNTNNPHSVTKAQVGLGNVDNKGSVSTWQSTPDNDHIPTEKLVKDSLDDKIRDVSFDDTNKKIQYQKLSGGSKTDILTFAGSTTASVTASSGTVTISSPELTLGTPSGSGNVVTDVSVGGTGGHQITLTKGNMQVPLVSGTNIQSINSSSILTSGNIDLMKPDMSNINVSGTKETGKTVIWNGSGWEYGEAGKVDDVRINGDQPANSIVTNKIAIIPITVTDVLNITEVDSL